VTSPLSVRLFLTPFPGVYFPPQRTVEVPREGGDMGKGKKARRPEWYEKATMSVQLLKGCAHLTVAVSILIHAVNNWPLY
jgi:hypothetical protein